MKIWRSLLVLAALFPALVLPAKAGNYFGRGLRNHLHSGIGDGGDTITPNIITVSSMTGSNVSISTLTVTTSSNLLIASATYTSQPPANVGGAPILGRTYIDVKALDAGTTQVLFQLDGGTGNSGTSISVQYIFTNGIFNFEGGFVNAAFFSSFGTSSTSASAPVKSGTSTIGSPSIVFSTQSAGGQLMNFRAFATGGAGKVISYRVNTTSWQTDNNPVTINRQ